MTDNEAKESAEVPQILNYRRAHKAIKVVEEHEDLPADMIKKYSEAHLKEMRDVLHRGDEFAVSLFRHILAENQTSPMTDKQLVYGLELALGMIADSLETTEGVILLCSIGEGLPALQGKQLIRILASRVLKAAGRDPDDFGV